MGCTKRCVLAPLHVGFLSSPPTHPSVKSPVLPLPPHPAQGPPGLRAQVPGRGGGVSPRPKPPRHRRLSPSLEGADSAAGTRVRDRLNSAVCQGLCLFSKSEQGPRGKPGPLPQLLILPALLPRKTQPGRHRVHVSNADVPLRLQMRPGKTP